MCAHGGRPSPEKIWNSNLIPIKGISRWNRGMTNVYFVICIMCHNYYFPCAYCVKMRTTDEWNGTKTCT